jgi:hypothetical protein
MSHTRFALGFTRHRKVFALSDAAFRLWVSAMDHAREQGRDGAIEPMDLDLIPHCPPKGQRRTRAVDELVRTGLWDKTADGWQIHDYLDWQDSSVFVRTKRERARERMRAVRANTRVTKGEVRDGVSSSPSSSDPPSDVSGSEGAEGVGDGGAKQGDRPLPRRQLLAQRIWPAAYVPLPAHARYAADLDLTPDERERALRDLRDKYGSKQHDEPWLDDKYCTFLETVAESKRTGRRTRPAGASRADTQLERQMARIAQADEEDRREAGGT